MTDAALLRIENLSVAYGATSRRLRRVKNRIALLQSASSMTHSSSEPSCDDQTAVSR